MNDVETFGLIVMVIGVAGVLGSGREEVAGLLFGAHAGTVASLEVEQKLLKLTPPEYLQNAHHWLILHGRYVCVARKPKCMSCVVVDLCAFKGKTTLEGAPAKPKRAKPPARRAKAKPVRKKKR